MQTSVGGETPDWQAIHTAHRYAEQTGLISQNARKVGAVPLCAAYAAAELDTHVPLVEPPALARRSNGFGSRGKTRRSLPFHPRNTDAEQRPSFEAQFERLATLQQEIEAEIDNPDRYFSTLVETSDARGTYLMHQYIYDEDQIAAIRSREHETLGMVIAAFRVSIFERDPRTKGFPSPRRIESTEEDYHNMGYLRGTLGQYHPDPLLEAMMDEVETRFDQPPLTNDAHRRSYWPSWQSVYNNMITS